MADLFVFAFVILIPGLILLAISRYYRNRIEQMDAEYTGDIVRDPEAEAWYHYGRRINYRIMKATKYMSFIFLASGFLLLLGLTITAIEYSFK